KVFRGIKNFNADSSLKTWIYRIALHEVSNHRRWWFRHKVQETSIEPQIAEVMQTSLGTVKSRLVRGREALRRRLERHLESFGLRAVPARGKKHHKGGPMSGQEIEVMP